MLPLFLQLAQDKQDSVRIHSIESAVALAKVVPSDVLTSQIFPVVIAIARDTSWRVRWSVANRFAEFSEIVYSESIDLTLCDCFVSFLRDTESEVRTVAASKVRHSRPCREYD